MLLQLLVTYAVGLACILRDLQGLHLCIIAHKACIFGAAFEAKKSCELTSQLT